MGRMLYGVPYRGSKNQIADKIIEQLPPAKHFYDVFAGGCAITHAALLSGKYKYIHASDIDTRRKKTTLIMKRTTQRLGTERQKQHRKSKQRKRKNKTEVAEANGSRKT